MSSFERENPSLGSDWIGGGQERSSNNPYGGTMQGNWWEDVCKMSTLKGQEQSSMTIAALYFVNFLSYETSAAGNLGMAYITHNSDFQALAIVQAILGNVFFGECRKEVKEYRQTKKQLQLASIPQELKTPISSGSKI